MGGLCVERGELSLRNVCRRVLGLELGRFLNELAESCVLARVAKRAQVTLSVHHLQRKAKRAQVTPTLLISYYAKALTIPNQSKSKKNGQKYARSNSATRKMKRGVGKLGSRATGDVAATLPVGSQNFIRQICVRILILSYTSAYATQYSR